MINSNYQTDYILYLLFKTILSISLKKHGENTDNPSIKIYANKIENGIMFKIKTAHYLELLTLGSTENKITKDKNGENVPHLEITEVVLVHCNIINNDYQTRFKRFVYTCSK